MQRLQIFWSSLIGTKLKQIGVWRNVGKRRSLPRCCGLLNVRELGHAVASRQTKFVAPAACRSQGLPNTLSSISPASVRFSFCVWFTVLVISKACFLSDCLICGEIGKVPIFPVTRLSPLSRRLANLPLNRESSGKLHRTCTITSSKIQLCVNMGTG